jgi:hypothetical protein
MAMSDDEGRFSGRKHQASREKLVRIHELHSDKTNTKKLILLS